MSQRARRRITSKFRLPSGRSYIGSHGYRLRAQGGDRDASEPEGVRSSAAGALPDGHARREGRAPGRGRRGHRPPPQGGDPPAPATPVRAGGAGAPDPAAARRLQLRRELDAALDRLWTLAAPDPRRPQGDTEIAAPAPESSPGDVSAMASVTLTYESTRLEG